MRPKELYRFQMGDQVWTMTSADAPIIYDGEHYVPEAVGRGNIESKNELSKANLEVRLSVTHALARLLMSVYREQVLGLTLFVETEFGTDVAWKGRLASFRPTDAALILTFESVFTSLRRPGLRGRYQRSCRHALYGRGCGLDPEEFAEVGRVTALTGAQVTIPEAGPLPTDYLTGGMLRAPDGTLGFIVRHAGTLVTLQRPLIGLSQAFANSGYGMNYGGYYGGVEVIMYPGCDHRRTTCKDKFGNLDRYGGFDWIPLKNPMGGSSIV